MRFWRGRRKQTVKLRLRIIGILATLRDDLIDVFDIEELRQRIAVQDLPLPLSFAIQGNKMNTRIILSLGLRENEVTELVNFTLTSKPGKILKNKMQLLIEEGLTLLNKLHNKKLRSKLQAVVTFMLEDLQPS